MATFTWTPSYNPTASRTPRIKSVQFGDGYEQRFSDGLNPLKQVWNVAFNGRYTAEADEIDAFLIARAGVENFDWTPPGGTAGKYVCKQWDRTIVYGNIENISAVFEQVFDVA